MTQPNSQDLVWIWFARCPRCNKKTLLHMNEAQAQERRVFIISEGETFAISGPLTCQKCETPSYLKLEVADEGELLVCLTTDPETESPMFKPQKISSD